MMIKKIVRIITWKNCVIFFAVEVSIILLRILAKKTDIRPAVENKTMQIEK